MRERAEFRGHGLRCWFVFRFLGYQNRVDTQGWEEFLTRTLVFINLML